MSTTARHKAALTQAFADWAEVRPGRVYDARDVAALFGVSPLTVLSWAKAGKVTPLPRLSPRAPVKFLGSTLLACLGDQATALAGHRAETPAERTARARAATARVAAMAAKK